MLGHIHSVESFGTVDGPGVRLVVFMQGCPLRCKYCHNPDTWRTDGGELMSVDDMIALYERNRPFYSRGGITVTGGEPLLQAQFVSELFRAAHERGIHTCLDTSGITYRVSDPSGTANAMIETLLDNTDLVMLDIKHIDDGAHRELTGMSNSSPLAFARRLSERGIDTWIRHVVVPGVNDGEDELYRLGEFIGTLSSVRALDVLPYHTMGVVKYEALGINYPLAGVEQMSNDGALLAKGHILRGYRAQRNRQKQAKD